LIEIVSISKAYSKGSLKIPALRNVSFSVTKGAFISIVGRSGSGKSTLLNLVGGLDHIGSGKILFNGKNIGSMSRRERALHRRHNIGMVFQSFNLIPYRNALENVTLALTFGRVPRKERKKRAMELLARVGLSHRLDHKPSELSGGEAQRVAIARALANNPLVLLADEPTGNLDTTTSEQIISLLKELNKEKNLTVMMVTHEMDIARSVSQEIIYLKDGEVEKLIKPGE